MEQDALWARGVNQVLAGACLNGVNRAMIQDAISGLGIGQAGLAGWLADHVPHLGPLRWVQKFGAGQSNPTYLLDCGAGRFVLRSKPDGRLLKSAHLVEREFQVMQALAGSAVPVPPVLHLEPDTTSPTGRAFFIMGFVPGRIFFDPALPDCPDRGAMYDAMNAALAALHSVDVAAAGLSDFGKPAGYFQRQLDRWGQQYAAATAVPLPDMARVERWLQDTVPPDDGQVTLVHGDWRIDNLMFAPDAPDVVAVLDWELSTLGHPFADLAYQCMQWRLPNSGDLRGLGGIDRAVIGLPEERAYVARYLERRGLGAIDNWPFYLGFSFFRLAAILAGVAARAEAGNASNPATARAYGRAVPQLAAMAVQVIAKGADG